MTKRLFRSNDRMLGGVCAGIAEYIGWDPTLVRIAYIVLSIVSAAFPGLLVYLILWIIIPPRY
ncbi:PspC domain-containing protein [Ekhidna sp.]|uniref:PspC domain-containing protein n=1 Tax=Ekhidna sp. TaxID=2608089 RepID=UPI003298E2BF